MRSRVLRVFSLLFLACLFVSGCAVNKATATLEPSADFSNVKRFHVEKFDPDKRGIDELIVKKLESLGYEVQSGEAPKENADVLVTYVDKWMWDITMYMIELTINFRDPQNNFPMASGNSYHTSLTRKSPEEMVDEVISNLFTEIGGSNDKAQ